MSIRPFQLGLASLLCISLQLCTATAKSADMPALIPWPKTLHLESGQFDLKPGGRIVATDERLLPLAKVLAQEIELATGIRLVSGSGQAVEREIVLKLDPALKNEAQAVLVTPQSAVVRGGNYQAVAMGTVSLLQAIRGAAVPAMSLSDEPSAPFRGLMVDCARRYNDPDVLFQSVVLCRLYKVRYLHLHLTDDQVFMFPSTKFPRLGSNPSWLPGSEPGKTPYDPQKLRELIRFADQRGVTIIPEIEMPGHSGAFQRDMPEIFGVKNPTTGKFEGKGVIDVTNEQGYMVLDELLGEVADMFASSPYIHIGGDETWYPELIATDAVKQFMKQKNLDVSHLHAYFLNRINGIVKKHGRKTIVWDGMDPQLVDKDILVFAWGAGHRALLDNGLDIVNVPWTVQVYSSLQSNYAWNIWQVSADNRPPEQLDRTDKVKGSMMVLWERNGREAIRLLRRNTAARSEITYHPDGKRTFADFQSRLRQTDQLLAKLILPVAIEATGFRSIVGLPEPKEPDERWLQQDGNNLFQNKLTVTLRSLASRPNEVIRYTLNGSDPSPQSPAYTSPLTITKADARRYQPDVNFEPIAEVVLKVRVFDGSTPRGFVREARYHYDYLADQPRAVILKLYQLPSSGQPVTKFPNFELLKLLYEGSEAWINMRGMPHLRVPSYYAAQWRGTLLIDKAGQYEFAANSFEGVCRLAVDDKPVLTRTETDWGSTLASLTLKPGEHSIFFEGASRTDLLGLKYRRAGEERWEHLKFKPL